MLADLSWEEDPMDTTPSLIWYAGMWARTTWLAQADSNLPWQRHIGQQWNPFRVANLRTFECLWGEAKLDIVIWDNSDRLCWARFRQVELKQIRPINWANFGHKRLQCFRHACDRTAAMKPCTYRRIALWLHTQLMARAMTDNHQVQSQSDAGNRSKWWPYILLARPWIYTYNQSIRA